jgi:hypothetical protein
LFSFLASFIIWISTGIHFPVVVVFHDICVEIDDMLNDHSQNYNPALDSILSCNNGSMFDGIKQTASNGLEDAANSACDAIHQLCDGNPFVYCPDTNCTENSLYMFDQIVRTLRFLSLKFL